MRITTAMHFLVRRKYESLANKKITAKDVFEFKFFAKWHLKEAVPWKNKAKIYGEKKLRPTRYCRVAIAVDSQVHLVLVKYTSNCLACCE